MSNLGPPLLRLVKLAQSGQFSRLAAQLPRHQTEQSPTPLRRQVRLSPARKAELVADYLTGCSIKELAERYGVHRQTVSSIISASGTARRQQGLDEKQITEAITRYAAGEPLATVGRRLGVDASTVRSRLLERGVAMRSTSGRAR